MNDPNPPKPGREPEHLKIDGDWEEAMKKAMDKPRPEEGWPNYEGDYMLKKRDHSEPASAYSLPEGPSPTQHTAEVGDRLGFYLEGDEANEKPVMAVVESVGNAGGGVAVIRSSNHWGARGVAKLKRGERISFEDRHIYIIEKA